MIAMTMPSDLPHEPTEIAVKLAAAQAAQATAAAAQVVADECQKSANEALGEAPVIDTGKVNLRELRRNATETVLHMLKKVNSPEK